MGPDFSFFALLFLIAQGLAPHASAEMAWVNGDHPDQEIVFTRRGARWAVTVNGRDFGTLRTRGDAVVHEQEGARPQPFGKTDLLGPLAASATRVRLRGPYAPTVLRVERSFGAVRLRDPGGEVLGTTLTLRAR